MYFLITTNEDGEVRLSAMEKDSLLSKLENDACGGAEIDINQVRKDIGKFVGYDLRAALGTFIIKGEIVVPKPKRVVQTFDID